MCGVVAINTTKSGSINRKRIICANNTSPIAALEKKELWKAQRY
jgi:hypothetical protein